jgi:hypothetical protein
MDSLHLAAELIEELLVAAGVHDGILLSLNHQTRALEGHPEGGFDMFPARSGRHRGVAVL